MTDKVTENGNLNIDAAEVAKFEAMAPIWWDKNGVQKALHDINVLRVDYINKHARCPGKQFWMWAAEAESCPRPWPLWGLM